MWGSPALTATAGLPSAEELVAGLDDDQRAAVTDPAPHVVVEAGAGSGKTRVLTHRVALRIATGAMRPERVAVFTFTRKAAAELADRLAGLGIEGAWVGTVHGAARQLVDRWSADRGVELPAVTRNPARLLADALPGWSPDEVAAVAAELAWARPRAITAAAYPTTARAHGRRPPLDADRVGDAMAAYEQHKRRRRVVDLDDLVDTATAVLDVPDIGDAVRWRIRLVAVDEAQDLNRAQWRFIRRLVGPDAECCLVGDPHQTVYQWNGADPRYLTRFEAVFPDASRHRLRTNHRSAAAVVAVGDRVLGRPRPTPTTTDDPGRLTIVEHDDGRAEAAWVAWRIRQLRAAGAGWSQIAVLARTRALLVDVERHLRRAGVPVRTGRSLLDEPVVRTVLAEVARLPSRQPARVTAVDLDEIVRDVLDARWPGQWNPGHQDPDPGEDTGRAGSSTDRGARRATDGARAVGGGPSGSTTDADMAHEVECCRQVTDLVAEWAATVPSAPTGQLVDWLRSVVYQRGSDMADHRPAVEVATFHRAKGLEFDHVILVGMEDEVVPLAHAEHPEEERRLCYVAVTRAERSLTCSWVHRRRLASGAVVERRPSPWLADVAAVAAEAGAGSPTASAVASDAGALPLRWAATDPAGWIADLRRRLAVPRSA
jgi:DNA helicase-2/ATP-dependent DNA helicase PcrA